jgi:predicted enzyme related to lactoylglutathione lyase
MAHGVSTRSSTFLTTATLREAKASPQAALGTIQVMDEIENPAVPARLGQVLHPVADVGAAVAFYGTVFGFGTKFSDGDRYAALDAGGATLALAGPAEDITDGKPAAAIKVADVGATVKVLAEAGGSIVRDPERGPHETRAVARDPWGNTVIIYGPK